MNISSIIQNYNFKNITIGSLGGHSGLDVCRGAKAEGFQTVVVAQNGREKTYDKYYRVNGEIGCVNKCIIVNKFPDILKPEVQEQLQKLNTIFIHNRYFWVYFNDPASERGASFSQVENNFNVPIFGTREMLKMEERDVSPNQYDILREARIRLPKIFKNPKEIDRLTLTKVNNATRTYERENFVANSFAEWKKISAEKIKEKKITQEALDKAVIEEFILGAQVNFNFFYSVINDRLELMGTDTRRQTNLDGLLRLPANEQLKLSNFQPHHIETGHIAVTVKESLVEKAYEAGEKFVKACKKFNPRGIIGPFALQGAIETDGKKEELVVFDVSLRIPGSPGTQFTPYSGYLFGENISIGRRIAKEIKEAVEQKRLEEILT